MMMPGQKISPVTLTWAKYLFMKPTMLRWYKHWRSSLEEGRDSFGDELPWMAYEAIDWLRSFLESDMRVFEWGAGGSTLFFAKRVHSVVAVEHDPKWFSVVSQHLVHHCINNVSLVFCQPERAGAFDEAYSSSDERYRELSFQRYAETIDAYPDHAFDLVVVDGRARPGCMKHARTKVRPGGYLLLDNSDREQYALGERIVSDWSRREFYGPAPYVGSLCGTAIWESSS
jgi:hypothetical protein